MLLMLPFDCMKQSLNVGVKFYLYLLLPLIPISSIVQDLQPVLNQSLKPQTFTKSTPKQPPSFNCNHKSLLIDTPFTSPDGR